MNSVAVAISPSKIIATTAIGMVNRSVRPARSGSSVDQTTAAAAYTPHPPASDQKANMDIVWTRQIGKGRVVYSALGHGKEAWTNPAWQKLIIQAIRWTAGKPKAVQIPGS